MEFRLLSAAAALCICIASAGILPASTQIFIPAASPAPSFVYVDQTRQQESLTTHPPLTYQLSLAYPGSPTPSAPPATLSGNLLSESLSSRGGDEIPSQALDRTSVIDRQKAQQLQQVQQRQRVDYITNEVGRREQVDGSRRPPNQQRQQIDLHQTYQQQQKQRYGFGENEAAAIGAISGVDRPVAIDASNLDLPKRGENIANGGASFVGEQRQVPQRQPGDSEARRHPDISSLTLSLQRQGPFMSGGGQRSQIPSSLSIQRQESQTEQRIAFQGVGVEAEAARFRQAQREQGAAMSRVQVAPSAFDDAAAGAFPPVLSTLSPTVASANGHELQQSRPTDSGFSSYSVQFVSPKFGYGYYGDQHSLRQQSTILVHSTLDGALSSNAVGASAAILSKQREHPLA